MVLIMMLPTKEAHGERFRIIVVMRLRFRIAANLTRETLETTIADSVLSRLPRACLFRVEKSLPFIRTERGRAHRGPPAGGVLPYRNLCLPVPCGPVCCGSASVRFAPRFRESILLRRASP